MSDELDPWLHAGPPWRRPRPGAQRLRPGGRYLVSGGTGALGRLVTGLLREGWGAEVVALSRHDAVPPGDYDGVFHLAGSTSDPWGSKRDGLLRLRAAARAPWWVLFSSVSAALPGLDRGIEDYAAANRWLDDFARSTPGVLSIAWAPWSGVGMAAAHAEALAERGLRPIEPSLGLRLLGASLAMDETNLLAAWRPGAREVGIDLDAVRAVIARGVGRDPDPDAPFPSLGIDSLMAVDLVREMEERLGQPLPPTLLFEAPTLRQLVDKLRGADAGPPLGRPLQDSQRTFVVQRRFYPDIPGSVFMAMDLSPPVEQSALVSRLSLALDRHEVLRSVILGDRLVPGGQRPGVEWGPVDDDGLRRAPFDLERGPLLRVACDGRRLALAAHHSVLDAWSLKNLAERLLAGDAPSEGPDWGAIPAAAAGELKDYAQRFSDGVPVLPLGRGGDPEGPPGLVHTSVDAAPLLARARALGVTLPALVLGAYARRFFAATGQHDVVIRVAHGRRPHRVPGIARALGPFADSLPVRLFADGPLDAVAARAHAALRDLPDASSAALAGLSRADAPTGISPAGFSFPLLDADTGPHAVSRLRAAGGNGFTGLGLVAWVREGMLELSWNFLPSSMDIDEVEAFASGLFDEAELPGTVHDRVLRAAALWPEREAAPGLSYAELSRRSAELAAELHAFSPARVGVLARPSPEALVAMLAAMRAGAAYVPLDPEWPDARIQSVIDAARLDVLLSLEPARFPGFSCAGAGGGNLAWTMFTSGSTGAPKGVEVSHAAACRWLDWNQGMVAARPGDRLLWTASIGFGGSIRQCWGPLTSGAASLPAPEHLRRDPQALLGYLDAAGVTVWNTVPSLWVRVMDAMERTGLRPRALRVVVVGGEVMTGAHASRWLRLVGPAGPRLVNAYGSTETVVNASWFVVRRPPDTPLVPIGRARAGVTIEIDGADVGEIVVRGAVAEGYLDGARFDGAYRTGDLGRRLPSGEIVYVGRRDSQVKVHGNRVEMGEVEGVLCQHPAVIHAAVRFDGERLHATVECRDDPGDLRAWLLSRLPGYMVPSTFTVAALARTSAGKVAAEQPRGDTAPGDVEARLATLWTRVLKLPAPPAPGDDFFALGGDSIALLDVLDAARDAGLGAPAATALYRARTLREAARLFGGDSMAAAAPREPTGVPPLTRAQRGFVLSHKLDPAHPPVWSAVLPLRGPLDPDRLRHALRAVVDRHPALRMVFLPEPRVVDGRVDLEYDDLVEVPGANDIVRSRLDEARSARFDLGRFPLFRARLCRVAEEDHRLVLVAHHALADGWSGWVLARELLALHAGERLPEPERAGPEPEPDEAWWAAYLRREPPARATVAGQARSHPPREAPGWGASEASEGLFHDLVDLPPVSFPYLLRSVFTAIHALTCDGDLVVSIAHAGRDSRRSAAIGAIATAIPVRSQAPFLDVAAQLATALSHAPATAPPGELARLGRYFLSWLDPASVPAVEGPVSVDWAAGEYAFATASSGTELMVGAMPTASGVRAHLDGTSLAAGVAGRLSEQLSRPDAALVMYLPAGTPLPIDRPAVVEQVDCALGRSELVLLPVTADRLEAAGSLLAAVPGATGARVAALAGMLPATHGLCTRPLWSDGPVATTGHAATVVAMVLTIEAALSRQGLRWQDLAVGVLGLGSIGAATLALARALWGEPRALHVRDPRVRLDDLGEAELIIGATSGGAAIDVPSLRPGTIVVDDSFPRAFDEAAALARMQRDGDVLLVGGGTLDAGPLARRSPYAEAESVRARFGARWLPGCHAEAILVAADPGLGPTIGPVTPDRSGRVHDAVRAAGWKAPPLHLGAWTLP
ncbi:MAG: AMP-binding protein [Deltaproteobacteria bacterium]|nr:AMP-binding protein [Deltaproteobacteria bacterium]